MITKRDDASRGLTREELLALPAAVDLETANRALSPSRTTGYDLAERGRYPCTVLRLGNAYGVVTADLLKLLHIGVSERPANDGHRLVCVISTSRATSVAKELCRSVHRIAKGRGAQGERGRLAGPPAVGPWDPELARAMEESGRTVMEERLLPALLSDLTRT